MLTGLSYLHPQHRYLTKYLELTNYTNPWIDMTKWNVSEIDFDSDVYVHFGLKQRPMRHPIWTVLCTNNNVTIPNNRYSCHFDKKVTVPLHELYKDMSKYKFGVSPPGKGYDCYWHYKVRTVNDDEDGSGTKNPTTTSKNVTFRYLFCLFLHSYGY
jgi:hypothetical protein